MMAREQQILTACTTGDLAPPVSVTHQILGIPRQVQFVATAGSLAIALAMASVAMGWGGRARARGTTAQTDTAHLSANAGSVAGAGEALAAPAGRPLADDTSGRGTGATVPPPAPPAASPVPPPPPELPAIPDLKGVDAIPAILTWTGRHAVQDLLGKDISELRAFLPETLDKSDTQPYIPSYVVKVPDTDRKSALTFGFVDNKLLRVGAWVRMPGGDVARKLRKFRKPDRLIEDTGTRIMTWDLGVVQFELSIPPGDKPELQWWLYESARYEAFLQQDQATRSAFAQSDAAASLVDANDDESLTKAVAFYQKAVELVPGYSVAWLRLCRVHQKLSQLEDARAACEKARDTSTHPAVVKDAAKLLEGL